MLNTIHTRSDVASDDCWKLLIKGITKDGRRFRPSDWAQRLATIAAQIGSDRRIHYHPRVKPTTIDGVHCVVVDRCLEQEAPQLFRFLVDFARRNNLQSEDLGRPDAQDAR